MKKYTNKENFLRILKKDKYYKGDSKFTIALYKKFLSILKNKNKCNSTMLFVHTSCRNKLFYINRGYSEEEAATAIKKIQSRGINFYNGNNIKIRERVLKRSVTFANKSPEEIASINNMKGLSWDPYYVSNKYNISVEEAQNKIKKRKETKVASFQKHLKSISGYKREWSCRCQEYYKKRNIRKEDIVLLKKARFDTRSIEAICNRYNTNYAEAVIIQQSVSKKCMDTFNQKTDEEKKAILISRTKYFKRYSKSSKLFFDNLVFLLKDLQLTFLYAEYERFIYDKECNQIFFYDLTIPELNIIVEYNGTIFHPRERDTWAITVNESKKRDDLKLTVAKKFNYELLYVWEKKDMSVDLQKITNIIRQRYDNRSN